MTHTKKNVDFIDKTTLLYIRYQIFSDNLLIYNNQIDINED